MDIKHYKVGQITNHGGKPYRFQQNLIAFGVGPLYKLKHYKVYQHTKPGRQTLMHSILRIGLAAIAFQKIIF